MKAIDHYRRSRMYSMIARGEYNAADGQTAALLAVAEAVQGLLMMLAVDEKQDTHYYTEWRKEWQSDPPPTRES